MKKIFFKNKIIGLCVGFVLFALSISQAHAVFINEIHYDNAGLDVDEGVELTGVAGQDLAGWSLLFYNGSNGQVYKNYSLGGIFTDMQEGMGVLAFAVNGIQNGVSDGVALVNDAGSVLQFLSYEGSLLANAGAAAGLVSIDIGVTENGMTPVGHSLQLRGGGRSNADFSWGVGTSSFGGVNAQQLFLVPAGGVPIAVPEPASGVLLLLGLLLLALGFRRKTKTALFAK